MAGQRWGDVLAMSLHFVAASQGVGREIAAALIFFSCFIALMAGLRFLQKRWNPHAELMRKAVHITSGLSTLSFPWLFGSAWPVWAIAVGCVVVMVYLRQQRDSAGAVLHRVGRVSVGEIAFPIAVAIVFQLSLGRPLLFIIPVLVLTLADAAGALTGIRYGLQGYLTDDGRKSVEGSVIFFLVAFLSTHVPLLLFAPSMGREETLIAGLILGLLVMLAEAASWRGLDNFFVPLSAYFLLDSFVADSKEDLRWQLFMACAITGTALFWRSRTTLYHSAAMGGAFLGFVAWSLGGWSWLVPMLLLFFSYNIVARIEGIKLAARDFQAVLRVVAGPFLALAGWRITQDHIWMPVAWIMFGGHLANVCVSLSERTEETLQHRVQPMDFARYVFIAWVLFGAPVGWVAHAHFPVPLTLLAGAAGISFSATLFYRTRRVKRQQPKLWLWEAGIATAGGAVAFAILSFSA